MERISYHLSEGLTPAHLERMHEQALEVIEKVGLEVDHPRTLGALAGIKGVEIRGSRVHFKDWLVQECTVRDQYRPDPERAWAISSGCYCLNTLDLDGQLRPATSADLVDTIKLADGLGMRGEVPVEPGGIPPKLRQVLMTKACWQHSRHLSGGYIYDAEPAEYLYEMAQVVGRQIYLGGTVIISPLKVNAHKLDLFWRFKDREVGLSMGNMPITGVDAPVYFAAAFVQGMAEVLAGNTLLHLVFRRGKGSGACNVYPFDMRTQSIVYGSPEKLQLVLAAMQVARFYGFEFAPNALCTMAKEPDAQAAAEKMAHVLTTVFLGARAFRYAGLLSLDEIWSPEQAVIDREIVDYARRCVEGYEYGHADEFVAVIADGVQEGTFLTHPTTVENHRSAFWDPELFTHEVVGQWRKMGESSLRIRARRIARQTIDNHHYELPSDQVLELDRIYRKAEATLG